MIWCGVKSKKIQNLFFLFLLSRIFTHPTHFRRAHIYRRKLFVFPLRICIQGSEKIVRPRLFYWFKLFPLTCFWNWTINWRLKERLKLKDRLGSQRYFRPLISFGFNPIFRIRLLSWHKLTAMFFSVVNSPQVASWGDVVYALDLSYRFFVASELSRRDVVRLIIVDDRVNWNCNCRLVVRSGWGH
jgi:hypothetical protein